MIGTILRISWLNLKRDRVAQALTFLLPIMFFSVFASVFGSQNNSSATARVDVAVIDEDGSRYSRSLVRALQAEGGLRVRTTTREGDVDVPLDRDRGEALVRNGDVPIAVVLPAGLGASPIFFAEPDVEMPTVQLLADVSDPIAPQIVLGLLQKASFMADPTALASSGVGMLEKYSGPLTPDQRASFDAWLQLDEQDQDQPAGGSGGPPIGLQAEVVNVLQPGQGSSPTIAFYAAGIGVMFLLFSTSGAGGTLLEEEESGTLDRLVGSRAGMRGVLVGKWLFLSLLGIAQLTVMFLWGAVAFGLPLWSHVPGFLVVTTFTAAAAAAFGLLLASVCRSRAQLGGISTIVILTMSAVGGSMFPRFLMSETMQQFGLVTFNAWALDAYIKVFWRDASLLDLWPQLVVLAGLATVFMFLARRFARRWEMG